MGYRDWGYGDGSSYERRASTSWVGEAKESPADARPASTDSLSYLSTSWSDRSRSSRASREVEAIIAEVDDAYWRPPKAATPHIPRQGGRHRADDDDDDADDDRRSRASDSSVNGAYARLTSIRSPRPASTDRASPVTRGAGGYSVSDATDYSTSDYSVSDYSRSDYTSSDYPASDYSATDSAQTETAQTAYSATDYSATAYSTAGYSTSDRPRYPTRADDPAEYSADYPADSSAWDATDYRARDSTDYRGSASRRADSTGYRGRSFRRAAVDEPDHSAADDPVPVAPVSPVSDDWRSDPLTSWDRRPVDTGEWRNMPETDEWERSEDTGEWIRVGHTSEWRNPYADQWAKPTDDDSWSTTDRPRDWRDDTSAGQWQRAAETGQFDRITDDRAGKGRARGYRRQQRTAVEPEPSWQDSDDTYWSGTRLAADDPRWVETPSTAPRSPAVSAPRSPAAAYSGPPHPPASSLTRPQYRPPMWRSRSDRFDEELLDYDPGGYLATLIYTALWFLLPILFLGLWTLTLDNTPPPPGCVTDVTGGGCQSEREAAITSLAQSIPQFSVALLASLVVAIVLRWANGTWRAVSLGLAAAVVGGGLSTVAFTALTG